MTPTEQLLDKLEDAGFPVSLMLPTVGYWRSQDVVRWEAQARCVETGFPCHLWSWETITACARKPIKIVQDEQYKWDYWVWLK